MLKGPAGQAEGLGFSTFQEDSALRPSAAGLPIMLGCFKAKHGQSCRSAQPVCQACPRHVSTEDLKESNVMVAEDLKVNFQMLGPN